jgi:hypothetical protein
VKVELDSICAAAPVILYFWSANSATIKIIVNALAK